MLVAIVLLPTDSNGSSTTTTNPSTTYAGATTVQRRNLAETDTESGTLSYARSNTNYNRLSGTVTWLPAVGS